MSEFIERYWRDAKPEDALRDPPLLARFRDDELASWSWESLTLIGYCRKTRIDWRHLGGPWLDTDGDGWACCQVYDVPDPGDGWRLIDVEKESHECEKQHWHPGQKRWIDVGLSDEFYGDLIYRRRIEKPKPELVYEPYTWDDREQLIDREYRLRDNPKTWFKVTAVSDVGGTLIIDGYRSDYFMVKYQWLDGSVCGRLV